MKNNIIIEFNQKILDFNIKNKMFMYYNLLINILCT